MANCVCDTEENYTGNDLGQVLRITRKRTTMMLPF